MIATDELVRRVRRLINESEEDTQLSLLSVDTRSINPLIKGLLPQAVAFVQKNKAAGVGCVNVRSLAPDEAEIVSRDSGCGTLLLPADFVELVSLQLVGWQRPCVTLYSQNSPEALAQGNVYTRAGEFRPVCVDGVSATGERTVWLYPAGDNSLLKHFVYEADFDIDDGLVGCESVLADAVAYYCVALLYSVFERQDVANTFISMATALCNKKK